MSDWSYHNMSDADANANAVVAHLRSVPAHRPRGSSQRAALDESTEAGRADRSGDHPDAAGGRSPCAHRRAAAS